MSCVPVNHTLVETYAKGDKDNDELGSKVTQGTTTIAFYLIFQIKGKPQPLVVETEGKGIKE